MIRRAISWACTERRLEVDCFCRISQSHRGNVANVAMKPISQQHVSCRHDSGEVMTVCFHECDPSTAIVLPSDLEKFAQEKVKGARSQGLQSQTTGLRLCSQAVFAQGNHNARTLWRCVIGYKSHRCCRSIHASSGAVVELSMP